MLPVQNRAGLAASALFVLLGALMIPYAGIQADEALFTTPLFPHITKDLRLPWVPHQVSLMVISYIGSLKTLVYWPIFRILGTGPWTLRIPVVLLGAITIFLFYRLAHASHASKGALAAAIGALLLATDPVFLLTNTFDWGPVAVEHVFLVTGCWLLYAFGKQQSRIWYLGAGTLCWGLALWNKAIFVWALGGLVVGGVLVFWPEIKRCLKPRLMLIAAAGFVCGALPLVIFNLSHSSATVTENAHLDPSSIAGKWIQVESAANGTSLFLYLAGEDWWPNPKTPQSVRGRAAMWIQEHLGEHRRTGMYYVFGALLLAAPWWWKHRAARFSLVFMAVSWLLMALTRGAGGSAHHIVLLWPFPILFVAVALASLPWRPLAWIVGVGMIGMNLLVLNQYVAQFERNGAGDVFTDAVYPLSGSLDAYADRTLYLIDWGMFDNLNLLHQGRLDLRVASGPLATDAASPEHLGEIREMLQNPDALILDHVREHEVFQDVGVRLERAARSLGYRKEVVRTIPDSNGRPMFEILRFVAAGPG
jgi:4-amino-4-deoxy-L-arabinose transferase-like glycosyltransferase